MQATAEGCVWGVAPCPSTLPATPRLIAACPNTTPTGHSPLPSTPHLHFPQHQFCQLRPIMLRPTIFSNSCPPCPTRPPLTSTSSNAISASLALPLCLLLSHLPPTFPTHISHPPTSSNAISANLALFAGPAALPPTHTLCRGSPCALSPPPSPASYSVSLTSTSSSAISASLALLAGSQVNEIATSPRMSPTGTKSKGKCGGSDQHCPRHPRFQTKLPRRRTSRIARKGPTPYLCLTAPHSHRFESKGEKG